MRIAINAHLLSPVAGYRQAGVSGYIQQLLQHFWVVEPQVCWQVYAPPGVTRQMLLAPPQVRLCNSWLNTVQPSLRVVWEQLFAPAIMAANRPDVVFCPLNVVPLALNRPTVVTIHDLAFLRYNLHRRARQFYLAAMTRLSIRKAAHIITVSEFTRNEVIELLRVSPRSVTAVRNGLDPRFGPVEAQHVEDFRQKKKLPPRFLLFVGTLEPRKNLVTLIRAYATVKQRLGMPLLIVGGKGWMYDDVFSLVRSLSLENDVHFVGFVDSDDLTLYYAAATAVAYPSIYEGFGLPPLEAMAVGTPVVTSDVGALREVVDNAALTAPPMDVAAWADSLVRITADDQLRRELSQRGLNRSRQFSWESSARQTLDILVGVT